MIDDLSIELLAAMIASRSETRPSAPGRSLIVPTPRGPSALKGGSAVSVRVVTTMVLAAADEEKPPKARPQARTKRARKFPLTLFVLITVLLILLRPRLCLGRPGISRRCSRDPRPGRAWAREKSPFCGVESVGQALLVLQLLICGEAGGEVLAVPFNLLGRYEVLPVPFHLYCFLKIQTATFPVSAEMRRISFLLSSITISLWKTEPKPVLTKEPVQSAFTV